MAVVYHWKHGWIPLDHTAALKKAKGDHKTANAMLRDAQGIHTGIRTRRDVAKAALDLPNVPESHRAEARAQLHTSAEAHGATHLLPGQPKRSPTAAQAADIKAVREGDRGTGAQASTIARILAYPFKVTPSQTAEVKARLEELVAAGHLTKTGSRYKLVR